MRLKDPDERTWLKGLAVECPLGQAVPSCPLNGLRNLPSSQIRHIVALMSDDQVHAAIESHSKCFRERTALIQRKSTGERIVAA